MNHDAGGDAPLLPKQWSSSYVSYWQPMLAADDITSGMCWFDYELGAFRIDGLFNPWPEQQYGHRLWMSEIALVSVAETQKYRVTYTREPAGADGKSQYIAQSMETTREVLHDLIVPQDILRRHKARPIGSHEVLGQPTDGWRFERAERGPTTIFLRQGTNHPVRMVTGDVARHASIRDFPTVTTVPIPGWIFAPHLGPASSPTEPAGRE